MRPESTSVTFRQDLAQVAQEYDEQSSAGTFAGRIMAPLMPVGEQAADYPIMLRENFIKPADDSRAEGASYNAIGGEFGKGTYSTEDRGLKYPIDDRRRRRFARFIDAEQSAARILWYQLLLAHEIRVKSLFEGAGFTSNAAATAWSSAAAVPLTDLAARMTTLEQSTGIQRDRFTLAIPAADKTELLATTQVIDKSKYTYVGVQPAELTNAQIAAMLEIKQVLTLKSAVDSKEEGVTPSMANIWTAGKVWLLVTAEENAPLEMPSAARTMVWTPESGAPFISESYRDDDIRADIVRHRWDVDEVLTAELDLMCLLQSSDA